MNILLLASHAVAEYDDLRMFSDLGYDVFAPGGYETPSRSGEGIRPALPDAPHHPELVAKLHETRDSFRSPPGPKIDWAKAHLHGDIIDWADAIIVHHFPEQWIAGQWNRIGHKRVIWRTCGQSNPDLEDYLASFRPKLQVVRYSPAERRYFEGIGHWAGQDALIRFGKYPDDYGPWDGGNVVVGNVTQHMKQRGDSTGYGAWLAATDGLAASPAGEGSEEMPGGLGKLDYYDMLDYLSGLRAYLYTGTTPASYTLGLIEAMLSGVPTLSIGTRDWHGPADLFEGPEITQFWADGPEAAQISLRSLLEDRDRAEYVGRMARARAVHLFDVAKIGQQWVEFLGAPS